MRETTLHITLAIKSLATDVVLAVVVVMLIVVVVVVVIIVIEIVYQ